MSTQNTEIDLATRAGIVGNVIASYLSRTEVDPLMVSDTIKNISSSLTTVFEAPVEKDEEVSPEYMSMVSPKITFDVSDPATIIENTVFRDGIVSLLDGKKYRTTKRHLATNGLTVSEYLSMFNLPADYPTVCQESSEKRSKIAKESGLGNRRKKATEGKKPEAGATTSEDTVAAKSDENGDWLSGLTFEVPDGITSVEDTIHDNYLICLEDGEHIKVLKRYLKRHHDGMTVDAYKTKWNLPTDYPTIPPALAAARAETAKKRWENDGQSKAA